MKTALAPEAVEFEGVVDKALSREGGLDLVARAEAGEDAGTVVERTLAELGVWELTPRAAQLDAEAAAAVCRVAGRFAAPYPIAERLAGDQERGIDAIAVVNARGPRVNGYREELRWAVSDGAARYAPVISAGPPLGNKLGALVSDVEVGDWAERDGLAAFALVLPCWTLLGMCERAFELTRAHLLARQQFGQPLASFQALQFRFADTSTVLQGFAELAKYTVWSVSTAQPGGLGDALALRLSALEAAEALFRTAHQIHGAMGFCDETPLSWLSRYSQPIRRLPWGRSETEARLLDSIETAPFAGLFSGQDDVDAILAP